MSATPYIDQLKPCGNPGCHCHIVKPAVDLCSKIFTGMEVEDVMTTLEHMVCSVVATVGDNRSQQYEMLKTHSKRLRETLADYHARQSS